MKSLFLIFFMFLSISVFSKEKQEFSAAIINQEKTLDSLFTLLRSSKQDKNYKKYNDLFIVELEKALGLNDAFEYPFHTLVKMSKITSPDNEFRLFNWNVESESGVHSFYCYILKRNGTVIKLRDNHRMIDRPESKTLNQNNWYGAAYYKIILTKKGKYTLLGWNGKNGITTQKIIETMTLSRRGAKFGYSIFEIPNERSAKKRVILEYSDEAIVSLKHYQTKKSEEIVFSHLSPSTPQMEGFYQYYYPDLSFDKFVLKNGKWIFETDTQMKNDKAKGDENYNAPE